MHYLNMWQNMKRIHEEYNGSWALKLMEKENMDSKGDFAFNIIWNEMKINNNKCITTKWNKSINGKCFFF